jgi:hypothetical protein
MFAKPERYLFPPNNLPIFAIILLLSLSLSFLLMGSEVFHANWSLIDDHEVYSWLGLDLHLPIADVWNTLITKTEVGSPQNRFRPTYYLLKILETVFWGTNIHLWYLARAVGFGIFIASIWWIINRFVGIWIGAVLLVPFLTPSFWPDIWARLGPSEIYGAAALGVMLLGADQMFASERRWVRTTAATVLAMATLVFIGAKETFVPVAGLSAVLLLVAGVRRLVPPALAAGLIILISGFAGLIAYIVQGIMAASAGKDLYENSIELPQLIKIGAGAFVHAMAYWLPLHLAAIVSFGFVIKRQGRPLRDWQLASSIVVAIFVFLVAMYVSQCVAYRSETPLKMRYDFPRELFVPLNCCLLLCYVTYLGRLYFPPAMINRLSVGFVVLLTGIWVPKLAHGVNGALSDAVARNIQATNRFFGEVQSIVAETRRAPPRPIILEAYQPWSWSYEPVFSLSSYLAAFGVTSPVSVRMHPDGRPSPRALDDAVEKVMVSLQDQGNQNFVPLAKNIANVSDGCISIGINGPAVAGCTGFAVKVE